MTERTIALCNGFNVEELSGWVEAMAENADLGMVTLGTRHDWEDGGRVRNFAAPITFAGDTIAREHSMVSDFPVELGGGDAGPAPGELLLAALGSCVTGSFAEGAAFAGVEINGLKAAVESTVDLRPAYGVTTGQPLLKDIAITLHVAADTSDEALAELGAAALAASPVAATIMNPVTVNVTVVRSGN